MLNLILSLSIGAVAIGAIGYITYHDMKNWK